MNGLKPEEVIADKLIINIIIEEITIIIIVLLFCFLSKSRTCQSSIFLKLPQNEKKIAIMSIVKNFRLKLKSVAMNLNSNILLMKPNA